MPAREVKHYAQKDCNTNKLIFWLNSEMGNGGLEKEEERLI